jgi:predicted Fe-Mo cluster-binding NifX family protein
MRLCIPAKNNEGMESPVSAHFGSAAFFVIVDSETLGCEVIVNNNAHHTHGMCQPLAALQKEKFDGVVVGGIGAGALDKLRTAGKRVYMSERSTVKDTVAAYRKGELIEVAADMTCGRCH